MVSVANRIDLGVRLVDRLGDGHERRAQRIVHRLDGLVDPVRSRDVLEAGRQLWQECAAVLGSRIDEVDYLLGLDAGGIAPVVGLAAASGIPYRIAWKLRLDLPGGVEFTEPHSLRPEMFAYGVERGQRILLVDDEITTGRTLANLAHALRQAGADPIGAACLIEDVRCSGRAMLEQSVVPLVALQKLR